MPRSIPVYSAVPQDDDLEEAQVCIYVDDPEFDIGSSGSGPNSSADDVELETGLDSQHRSSIPTTSNPVHARQSANLADRRLPNPNATPGLPNRPRNGFPARDRDRRRRRRFGPFEEPARNAGLIMSLIMSMVFTGTLSISGLLMIHAHSNTIAERAKQFYTPAKDAEKWTVVRFDGDVHSLNEFKVKEGEPKEKWRQVDMNWRGLYDVEPFTVPGEKLAIMNESSMEVPSRPGEQLVKLAVFHQLHCLDMIRKYVHHPHYNFDNHHGTVPVLDHVDHCIDILRQTLTCRADTALVTFSFDPENPKPAEPNFNVLHECHDFDMIKTWAKHRSINMEREFKKNLGAFLPMFRNVDLSQADKSESKDKGKFEEAPKPKGVEEEKQPHHPPSHPYTPPA